MLHCCEFTFKCIYKHISAHQDDNTSYQHFPRPAQLNCQLDAVAKQAIYDTADKSMPIKDLLPLELIAVLLEKKR